MTNTSRTERIRRIGRVLAAAVAIYCILLVAWLTLPSGATLRLVIASVSSIVMALLPAAFALQTAVAADLTAEARAAWRRIGAALLAYTVGYGISSYFALVLGRSPVASPADIFFLLFYPLMLWGLLTLPPRADTRDERGRIAFDAAITALGAGMVVWYLITRPAGSSSISFLAVAYPLADLMLLFGLVAVFFREPAPSHRTPLRLLMLGTSIFFISDVLFTSAVAGHLAGHWSGVLRNVAFLTISASAYLYRFGPPAAVRQSSDALARPRRISVLPYLSLAAGTGLLVVVVATGTEGRAVMELAVGAFILTLLVIARQVSAIRQSERTYRELDRSEARFRSLVQHASDLITVIDADLTIRYQSPTARRLLGRDPEQLVGTSLEDLAYPDDRPLLQDFVQRAIAEPRVPVAAEWRLVSPGERLVHLETYATNLLGDGVIEGIVLNSRDVTERKHLEEELIHRAYHDPLTGLANRTVLDQRLESGLPRLKEHPGTIAVLYLDLDRFKHVNDRLGHDAGDKLLLAVASRLAGSVRSGDVVARLGGDEFAILLSDIPEPREAVCVAKRILGLLEQPVQIGDQAVTVGTSIGIAIAREGEKRGDVLKKADRAMYMAKRQGRGQYVLHTDPMGPAPTGSDAGEVAALPDTRTG